MRIHQIRVKDHQKEFNELFIINQCVLYLCVEIVKIKKHYINTTNTSYIPKYV